MPDNTATTEPAPCLPRVGLFVTCLVDLFRPNVGFAAVRLLENAGCAVAVPPVQTCCGQPAYNSGDMRNTRAIARQVIDAFAAYEYIVAPSGSCAGMIKVHYPKLFATDLAYRAKAQDLANRTYELVSFLTDVMAVTELGAGFDHTVTYHDSCSGLRELDIRAQPRELLGKVSGLELAEMPDTEVCCGFGGTFCVKYPEISERMVCDKAARIGESKADIVLAGDMGCLLNIAGRLKRDGSAVTAYHVAEVLAGMASVPGIGEADEAT
ncbi:MAG: (Fe-S)-binding protein [Gammaproteobacteria bacterium]